MNLVVLVDEKPKECKECLFFHEALDNFVESKPCTIEIVEECYLTRKQKDMYEHCPLTEIKAEVHVIPKGEENDSM